MEKSPKISVFWAKIQKNFLTRDLISLTKYWNSVTVGSPDNAFENVVCKMLAFFQP